MQQRATRIYELTRNPRPYTVGILGAVGLVFGVGELAGGDPGATGTVFVAGGALFIVRAAQIGLAWPTRLVVGEDGITFCAAGGDRFVPWSDLRSVRVSHGRHGGGIRWRLAARPHVTSAATFDRLHHLLVDIEHHAPHVKIIDR